MALPPTLTRRDNAVVRTIKVNAWLAAIKGSPLTASERVDFRVDAPREVDQKINRLIAAVVGPESANSLRINSRENNARELMRNLNNALAVAAEAAALPAPSNTALPTIAGVTTEGQTLTGDPGVWADALGLAYQWTRNGVPIAGAINPTRILTAADVGAQLRFVVSATNTIGTTVATSAPTAAIAAAPVPVPGSTIAPVLSGVPEVGEVITCTAGTWSNAPNAFAYQFRRDGVNITGATEAEYELTGADAGTTITCRVSATNAGGTGVAVSNGLLIEDVGPDLAQSVEKNGVTFTFAQPAQVGQYANGDWWVVAPVSIVEMAPASQVQGGRTIHGAMVNPGNRSFTGGSTALNSFGILQQGWDSFGDAMVYNSQLNRDPGKTATPLAFAEGAEGSVVKVISDLAAANGAQQLPRWMVTLTVVAAPPVADAFRPAIAATSKASLFRAEDLDLSPLPSFAAPASAPAMQAITDTLAGPFPLYYTQNTGSGMREFMPQNFDQEEYGGNVSRQFAHGLLALCLNRPEAQKRALAINIITHGIDVVGRITEGGSYPDNGGGEGWRKAPVVLAATLLQSSPSASVLQQYANAAQSFNLFGEDKQYFTVDQADVDQQPLMSIEAPGDEGSRGAGYTANDLLAITGGDQIQPAGVRVNTVDGAGAITSWSIESTGRWFVAPANPFPAIGGTGNGATIKMRTRESYAPFMIGSPEWGESPTDNPAKSGANTDATSYYRMTNGGPMVEQALAMEVITGAKALWNYAPFFDYHTRYWNVFKGDPVGGSNRISQFGHDMLTAFKPGMADATAPARAAITADANFVWVTFDHLMDERAVAKPAAASFTLQVNGAARAISYVRVWGKGVGLRTAVPIAFGDVVTLAYAPGATPLRNHKGVNAAGWAAAAVNNTVPSVDTVTQLALADNGGTAYSKILGPPNADTNVRKFLFSVAFRVDVLATGTCLIGGIEGGTLNSSLFAFLFNTISTLRLQLSGSGVFRQATPALAAGALNRLVIAVDFTKTTAALQGIGFLNGARIPDPTTFDATGTRAISIATIFANDIGIMAQSTGVHPVNGAIEHFFADWGGSDYVLPDITDPVVLAKFETAALVESNFQGPTGGLPKLAYGGALAEWNAAEGLPNKGSIGSRPAIKQTVAAYA